MGSIARLPAARLVDPYGVPITYCTALGDSRLMGKDRVLFTLYEIVPIIEDECGNAIEHRVVAKIAMERDNVWCSIRMAMATVGLEYTQDRLRSAFKYAA